MRESDKDNSTEADKEHKTSGRRGYYRQQIYETLKATGEAMTDRQLMEALDATDPNLIRPEVTRLKDDGILVTAGKVVCPVTGHKVRLSRLSGRPFIARWAAIEDDRVELCKSLVELVDYHKCTLRYISRECPKISIQMLQRMERVGRGDYHPTLLTPSTPGESMLALMDYQEQVRGLEDGGTIPVATLDEKTGEFGVRLLTLTSLTTDQVNQVSRLVKKQRVYISMDEQKAWLVDHRTNLANRPSRKDKPKWIIKDGNAVILDKNTVMAPAELLKAATEAMSNAAEPVVT